MAREKGIKEEKPAPVRKPRPDKPRPRVDIQAEPSGIAALQNQMGNAAVQRLLIQREGNGPTELDEKTAGRINRARGGGQALDEGVQQQMGNAMGYDFSNVRVHTSAESDQLNQGLSSKAFTTGHDVFFRDGAYNAHSSGGQELIAHELTHVVQQGTGAVQSEGKMAVNQPGDRFEREADGVAKSVVNAPTLSPDSPGLQRQELPEEEEQAVATKEDGIQRQELPEEEEEMVEMKEDGIQRQEEELEDEVA